MSSNDSSSGRWVKVFGRTVRAVSGPSRGSVNGAWHVEENGLLIGHDRSEVRIPWPDEKGGRLILIFGKRGTGKTELLRGIQQAAIMMGHAVVTVNGKADRGLSRGSKEAGRRMGRTVMHWSESGPNSYNPFAHGTSLEIADQLLAGEAAGTHPHYLRKAQRYLGHLVRGLLAADEVVSLATIIEYFDRGDLGQLLQDRCENTSATRESQLYLAALSERQWEELSGTRDRLAIVAESEAGAWLEAGEDSIDLRKASENNELLDFLVDGDGVPLLSQMISTAIILDLNKLLSDRNKRIEAGEELAHLFVFIDEFGGIPADLSSIAARGRSANVTLVLSTQDLYADTAVHEGLRDRLLANFDALVSLREQSPLSAEIISKVGGKVEKQISSWDDKGGKRTTLEEVPRIVESQIMDMPDYHGAVILPGQPESKRVRVARLLSGEQIAKLRYE